MKPIVCYSRVRFRRRDAYDAILNEYPENNLAKACLKTITIVVSYQKPLR